MAATSQETIYGSLYISPLAWGTIAPTAFQTQTLTVGSGLVSVIGADGLVNYEGRLAVVRGGLGNNTLWNTIRGDWASSALPTQTVNVTLVGISSGATGQFSAISAAVDSTPNTIVIRDSSGNVISNNLAINQQIFYNITDTSAVSGVITGNCVTNSSNTGSAAPVLVSFPLGTWSGVAGVTNTSITAITGRGSAAVRNTNSGTAGGGASIEIEFKALYNGNLTGTNAWTFPTALNRISRVWDSVMTGGGGAVTNTTQLLLQLNAQTESANPRLMVSAVGQPALHYWSGIFHVTAQRY
jgi:hypothetical protein